MSNRAIYSVAQDEKNKEIHAIYDDNHKSYQRICIDHFKRPLMSQFLLPFSSPLCSDGNTVFSICVPRWRKCPTQLIVSFRI